MTREISFFAYDTLCTVSIEVPSNTDAGLLLEGARDIALAVESTLSMYDTSSELSRLCANYEVGKAYEVSDMLFHFLETNLQIAEISGGAFDPTVGPLVKLWDFLSNEPQIPDQELIARTLQAIGYQHIKLDSTKKTVLFDTPGIIVDPGASGKGFSLGLVSNYLRDCGVTSGVCNFGGNIFAIGTKEDNLQGDERPWKVAILNPTDTQNIIGTVELKDMGVSTSSWYEHCFVSESTIFHHLLDTHTGMPKPLHFQSVSILSSNAFFTDLLSTTFFMLDEAEGMLLLDKMVALSGEVIEYVAVSKDGNISYSPGSCFHHHFYDKQVIE